MSHEPMERDDALGDALREVADRPADASVDWHALRAAVTQRAAPELRRRRVRHRMTRFAMPVGLAAAIFLSIVVSRPSDDAWRVEPIGGTTTQVSIEELLDADVTDGEFRALLAGADEADDLLLIAAGDGQQ